MKHSLNIFSYTNYRAFLRDLYLTKKSESSGFSHRVFVRMCGFASPNFLKLVIEGKRDASTLKFDADEAKYMAGRFNNNVRNREADEPYMDDYNKSNFEQVITVRRNPTPVKLAYQKL